ncbi:putative bifunctional diguanylate cyclase/phosphodiesterase [Pontixanthobacter aquaemixtae]|uniref:EAL domain-containing protein n=1 Tax=Pontixanthobacter aquaemixtae TaxID=1958940 RepID=A0A844ZRS8_9SPHN|nr:EAL domain-containing protein [Pontixanthobacter aquaemixtae]MXO90022.1 EAL domain-containing protein [Pontixanthobacter aquaemixtae]
MKSFLQGFSGKSDAGSGVGGELRLRVLDEFDKAGIGWIWATDPEGKLIYLADRAREKLGCTTEELIGRPLDEIFELDDSQDKESSGRSLKFQLKARNKVRDQVVRFALDNPKENIRQTWWSISGHPVRDDAGEFVGYRGNATDVTIEYERKLMDSRLADYDSLTGLANRHNMDRAIDSTLAAFKAAERPCALMMMDLDKFKRVNDTLGHQAGDALLIEVAERLRSIVGDRGKIARLGGDEFQVLIADEDDRGKLGELADKIIQILSQPYPLDDGKRAVIGASVGIAVAPFDGAEREDLIRSADLALYAAKNGGRGQFRFYAADLKNEEQERESMLDDLRIALESGQLHLEYQPVVSIKSGAVVCLEALMRWDHPERGPIAPGSFIPIAEESDLINNLGEWALRTACETAASWPKSVRIAVNVSAVQFASQGLPTIVANALAHSGLEADRLELELTESIFVGDSTETEETFAKLKGLGVRLALDDFGTGYSSLSYLRSAPFDKIKVDKSFVESCTQKDKNSAKIIAAIVGLSSALNMETTVEGVEAFDQLEVVKSHGAKLVQGFIYSPPLSDKEVLDQIDNGVFIIEPDGPSTYRPDRRTVYRRVGAIHDDYYYNAVMRNLSRNGAGIEGIVGVEVGTDLVLDLGEGQLAVCKVIHLTETGFGVEFETHLTSDGSGGLCTRHRVSPYTIAAAGLPVKPGTAGPTEGKRNESKPKFLEVAASNISA